ncbi:MAG: hypothetical protein HQK54_05145, partial [Oligoflexales bacterium]|nr:hypothetical protein [Oligoflexales bacterium]
VFEGILCAARETTGIYTRVSHFIPWIKEKLNLIKSVQTNLPLQELVEHECYDAVWTQVKSQDVKTSYRFQRAGALAITKQEYETLKLLPSFGTCDLGKYGLKATFIQQAAAEKINPMALIDDGRGKWIKVPYRLAFEYKVPAASNSHSYPKVQYTQETQTVAITNTLRDQIVTWQISCPFAFSLRDQDGRSYKSSESYPGGRNFVVFRYPESNKAVIDPGTTVKFVMGADQMVDQRQFESCSVFR